MGGRRYEKTICESEKLSVWGYSPNPRVGNQQKYSNTTMKAANTSVCVTLGFDEEMFEELNEENEEEVGSILLFLVLEITFVSILNIHRQKLNWK